VVSSAYVTIDASEMASGMSLVKMMNKRGERIEPCPFQRQLIQKENWDAVGFQFLLGINGQIDFSL
jgi:hypothetical protein